MEKTIHAVWQPQASLQSNTEMRDWAQFYGKAKQHSYSFQLPWHNCLLQNTASAVSTRDRDFRLLFIKGPCKRNLCSIINRLPDTTETSEYMLSCYSPILNILLLQLSIHLCKAVDHCIHQKLARNNTFSQKNCKRLEKV